MRLAMPSRAAIINDIVSGEELMNAISLNFMGMNALQLVAPVAAGFLVDAFDFKAVYYAMTVFYLIAIVLFTFVPATGKRAAPRGNAVTQVKQGLEYVWRQKNIRLVLFLSVAAVVLSSPWGMLMPFFVDDILHVGAGGMGILLSTSGAGAVLASILLASLPNRRRGMIMLVGALLLGLSLCGFASSRLWLLSLLLIALVGIGGTLTMTLTNTLVQYYADDNYRGRVMSLFMMQFGLASFGNFASGLIGQEFGVQWAVGSFAVVLVLVAVFALAVLPQIRMLD